jgi:cobalt/nickel transport system permease protein
MHMSDALVSPAVAGSLWAASAGVAAMSARALRKHPDDRRIPLMGVLGAFVFAAQLMNFAIPGTGSSGHLGGGLLLSILLGPSAAFLVMTSVLTVQALFFADGGLLALGCNIFNLGFFSTFVAYPLVFSPIARTASTRARLAVAAIAAAVVGLQFGSLGVVFETILSGRTELSLGSFLLLMQPIHLAIGVVEGLVTAALVLFVRDARPDLLLAGSRPRAAVPLLSLRRFAVGFLLAAFLTAGILSGFASSKPDGLEWSLARASAGEAASVPAGRLHSLLARIQARTALLAEEAGPRPEIGQRDGATPGTWPPRVGPSVPGLAGAVLTLALSGLVAVGLRALRRRSNSASPR